jgi:hypothetical protein
MNISNVAATAALPFQLQLNGTKVLGSDTSGNVDVTLGNLVIGTAGKGIDFTQDPNPAGMTSELLDDYEEGTFTPVIFGTGVAGTGTYSNQGGRYQKIGNTVHFEIVLVWSAHTGSGDARVSGLPFTAISGVPESVVSVLIGDIVFVGSPVGIVQSGAASIALASSQTASGPSFSFPLGATGVVIASGQYTVA